MKKLRRYLPCVFFCFSLSASAFNQATVDSLNKALSKAGQDVDKINIYRLLSVEYRSKDTTKALEFAAQSLKLSEKNVFAKGMGAAYIQLGIIRRSQNKLREAISCFENAYESYSKIQFSKGILQSYEELAKVYRQEGKYDEAYSYYKKIEDLAKKTGDRRSLMEALTGYANILRYRDDYVPSLQYYLDAAKIAEELKDKRAEAGIITNMSIIYGYQKNFTEETKLLQKALDLFISVGDSAQLVLGYNNLGQSYYAKGDKEKAKELFGKAETVIKSLGEERIGYKLMSDYYAIMGMVAYDDGDYTKALEEYKHALFCDLRGQEKKGAASSYGSIGRVYMKMKRWEEARENLNRKLELAQEIGYGRGSIEAYQELSQLFSEKGDFRKAYEYQALYVDKKEKLLNETSTRQLAEMQTRFESEKKEKAIQLQNEEIQRQNDEAAFQSRVLYAFVAASIIFLLLAFFAMRQYRQKNKANQLLELQNEDIKSKSEQIHSQKEIIEEKNKDITDSINYAKHIQESILPPDDILHQYLKESFVLYKPKDIVSGDIYWVHRTEESVMFAAIDCTGHGVPGALMSVLGYSAINTVITRYPNLKPSAVLNHLNNAISETFKHQYHRKGNHDGMDMSLCSLNRNEMKLHFAGARNPLCLVRNGQLVEIKGDKQAIAGSSHLICEPFTHHEVPVEKGDCIYIFSDGYGDQFGGQKGKKFKYSQLKELLLSIASKPMFEQKNILNNTIEEWRGNLQQIDDMLVIGVRV